MKKIKLNKMWICILFLAFAMIFTANCAFVLLSPNSILVSAPSDGLVNVTIIDGNKTTYYQCEENTIIDLPALSDQEIYKVTSTFDNEKTEINYLQNDLIVENPIGGGPKLTSIDCIAIKSEPKSNVTLAQYISANANPQIKIGSGQAQTNSTIFDPGPNGSNEVYSNTNVVPFHVTNINKTVKFIFNDGASYTDADHYVTNPSASVTINDAYHAIRTEGNNLITLMLMNDLTISSNGKLILEAQNGKTTGGVSGNVISGGYTALDLNGHSITIENGGIIYGNGLIYDSSAGKTGEIVCENGSTIYSSFLVEDFGGGGHTVGSYTSGSVPFTLYSMPYLNCTIKFKYGSKLYGLTQLYAYSQYNRTVMNVIGPDDTFLLSMHTNSNDAMIIRSVEGEHNINPYLNTYKKYLPYVKYQEIYTFEHCQTQLNSLKMDLTFSVSRFTIPVQLDMSGVHFPIPPWIKINVTQNSSFSFSQRVDMFPDSKFYCDETSSVSFANNAGVMTLNNFLYSNTYTINPYASNSLYAEWNKITDIAEINIDGTLSVSGNNNTLGGNINLQNNGNNYSEFSKLGDDWSCYFRGTSSTDNIDWEALFGGLGGGLTEAALNALDDGGLSSVYIYPRSLNGKVYNHGDAEFNYFDNTYTQNGTKYFYYWPDVTGTRNTPNGSYQQADDIYSQDVNVIVDCDLDGNDIVENKTLNIAVKKNNEWFINFAGSFIETLPIDLILDMTITTDSEGMGLFQDKNPKDPTPENGYNLSDWDKSLNMTPLNTSTFEFGEYSNLININADARRYNTTTSSESCISDIQAYFIDKVLDETKYNSILSDYWVTKDSYIGIGVYHKDWARTGTYSPLLDGYGQFYYDKTMCLWKWRK